MRKFLTSRLKNSYSDCVKRIHFIGIGGVGINALAKFSAELGADVSGSDDKQNDMLPKTAYVGRRPEMVDGAAAVVYSAAVRESNEELLRARELGIPCFERSVFLGRAAKLFEKTVAIAGTHGKTTTTAMLCHILSEARAKFVGMIGGESVEFGNFVNCAGDLRSAKNVDFLTGEEDFVPIDAAFVAEACEYRRSFLSLSPKIGAVTSIECDHPDCYKTSGEVYAAFGQFLRGCQIKLLPLPFAKAFGYSNSEREGFCVAACGAQGETLYCLREEKGRFFAVKDLDALCPLDIPEDGEYNLHNALFAAATADLMGVDFVFAAQALRSFEGVKRRFEYAGRLRGAPVYFDFAHHPTELSCAIERAKRVGRTVAVFQPHTFSRTKAYLDGFARALGDVDGELILMPTYGARENEGDGVSHLALADRISTLCHKTPTVVCSHAEALVKAAEFAAGADILLFLGAGDIYAIKDMLRGDIPKQI